MKLHIVSLIFICFNIEVAFSRPQPHIIFIFIDDLGWNDVSFHGSKQLPTPNIDALANDGIILNNHYSQPICTPSRGSLMTGKYPLRLGLQHGVITATAPWGLSPEEKILPQYLQDLGYSTYGVGKWHLGFFQENYLPMNRGFDSFFGYWNGKEDYFTHWAEGQKAHGLDLHDNNINAWNYTMVYATELFTDKAISKILNHNTSKPLFLYLSHLAVHTGNSYGIFQAPQEYINRFPHIKDPKRRAFAAMSSALDDSIGDLFESLHKAKILHNSLIVFTTDNGGAVQGIDKSTGSNWPLRGSKYSLWEGGVRTVAFVWSLMLRKKKIRRNLMHISDWLPTLYSIAGGDEKDLGKIDGYNQWKSICCNERSPRQSIVLNIDPILKTESIRLQNYKLVKGSNFRGRMDGWFDKEGKNKENIPFTDQELHEQLKVYKKLKAKSKVVSILRKISKPNRKHRRFDDEEGNDLKSVRRSTKYGNKSEILIEAYEPAEHVEPYKSLIVECGERPLNISTNCEPAKAACLFDISADPCEYNNLADIKPKIVKRLEWELDKYRDKAVHIRNKKHDPFANPKYHGYAWSPWKKTDDSDWE